MDIFRCAVHIERTSRDKYLTLDMELSQRGRGSEGFEMGWPLWGWGDTAGTNDRCEGLVTRTHTHAHGVNGREKRQGYRMVFLKFTNGRLETCVQSHTRMYLIPISFHL